MALIEVRLLKADEAALLAHVADDVFDNPVDPALSAAFLADPRHHIVAAIDQGLVVGFASGVDYIHPDKPAELWINEVGVAPTHQGRGIGKRLVARLIEHGRSIGCQAAWVLTEAGNRAARALYTSSGGVLSAKADTPEDQVLLFLFSGES